MKRGKVTALVMAFIMAVSVLASPVTMLNTNAAVKAKKITMAKKATLEVGAKKKLKVTVKPAKAKVKITFRTSNSRIAKVNSKGVVKGVKAGQATITAKAKVGKKVLKAKQKITVKKKAKQTPAAIKITSLTVKKYDVTINEGNIETMAVTVLPANATNKKLQYTTSDNNVATVDNKGVITAIAQGSCKVTAETMDGSNRSISVNVTVTKTQRPRCIITQDAEVDDGALLDNYVTWGDGTYLDGEEPGSQFGTNEDLLDSLDWWGGFNPVQKYQRYDFLSEGDSPTFFMLLDTGLRTLEDVTNGGFSGRYAKADKKNSKGQEVNYWSPVKDTYVKEDGNTMQVESSWKYIDDIQNDFASRADWCIVNDYAKANHAPKVSVTEGTDIKASAGETLKLHAIATDPDDDYVTVSWSEYTDASTTETALTLKGAASDTISFKIPEDAKAGQKIHLIVQAQDDGEHTLTHYQQVIITIK